MADNNITIPTFQWFLLVRNACSKGSIARALEFRAGLGFRVQGLGLGKLGACMRGRSGTPLASACSSSPLGSANLRGRVDFKVTNLRTCKATALLGYAWSFNLGTTVDGTLCPCYLIE